MTHAFFQPPAGPRYALRNLSAPPCLLRVEMPGAVTDGLVAIDLLVEEGRIAAIEPAGAMPAELGPDLDASMVLPGMVDCHTHLDKGHIWPRQPNLTGDGAGAAMATGLDRKARWVAEDVRRRMEFGLATAYAKGVVAIRTHLDSLAPQAAISFPVFRRSTRTLEAGRVEMQASSIAPLDIFLTDEGRRARRPRRSAAGGQPRLQRDAFPRTCPITAEPMPPEFDVAIDRACSRWRPSVGSNVDLHVDEATDPTLAHADAASPELPSSADFGFRNEILCGHCCALALQTEELHRARRSKLCAQDANVDIVSLPTVNMYLQDRRAEPRTPRWRGVTVLHEMKDYGLRVAVAGDNCRDPFYAYGDHDMLDTFTQAVKILHLDHPLGDWIRAATETPAAIMGIERGTLAVGGPADLLVLKARNYSEMLSRAQFDRAVIRDGVGIDTTLPDYRLLDDLLVA